MQYWKPKRDNEFEGDMMPFWDGARFHLFYLLDRDHHAEQGGLGGHQWAHRATADLVHWHHHPLAVPLGAPGSVDQHGICTGSIFERDGVYHAFYATRLKRPDGSVYEALCRAESRDLVHFQKSAENPLFGAPPGLDPKNHRDPFVFRHPQTGQFHMLVTALQAAEDTGDTGERGILAHYTSENLDQWQYQGPFLPLSDTPCPECPEHFFWNGWWYLLYSQGAQMQYRVSRDPLGPWERAGSGTIEGPNLSVPRTALFHKGRRLAVGFLPWRRDSRDEGDYVYAGSAVFRELGQDADGALSTRFVPELTPRTGPPTTRQSSPTAPLSGVPVDALLKCRLIPTPGASDYGLLLRADPPGETGYRLCFQPGEKRVTLQVQPERGHFRASLSDLDNLDQPVDVVICMKDSVIDVSLNERHTLVERCFDHQGTHLHPFAAELENVIIAPLTASR